MENTNYKIVYKMKYAMKLIELGHKIFTTMPNPRKPDFTCWVFKIDETLLTDLEKLKGEQI